MPTEGSDASRPKVTKLRGRRVRTEPVQGQGEEPSAREALEDSRANDERLKADKPPHY